MNKIQDNILTESDSESELDTNCKNISHDDNLQKLYDIIKTNYYQQIKNIKNKYTQKKIIDKYTNNIQNISNNNIYLDILAEDFNFKKTNLNTILTKNDKDKNSNLYFYVDNINSIYQSHDYKKIKHFIEIICEKYKNNHLVQIVSNDSKRKCIFNYSGEDKNNLISELKEKYNYKIHSYNNYIICDIITENYNKYTNICEDIFKYLATKSIKYNEMSIIKNKYDDKTNNFYSEFIFNLDGDNYKEILNSLPISENLHNIVLNIYDNSIHDNNIKGNNNTISNIFMNEKEKAKEWINNNCNNEININDIIDEFKKDNPNVKHTQNFIANILKELGYKKIKKNNKRFWKK